MLRQSASRGHALLLRQSASRSHALPKRRRNKVTKTAALATDVLRLRTNIEELDKQSKNDNLCIGLDISTRSTGYAVLNPRGKLLQWGTIEPEGKQTETVLAKAASVVTQLEMLRDEIKHEHSNDNNNWVVGIEEFMKSYSSGGFNTKGLFTLAQYNGILAFQCYTLFGVMPVMSHPSMIRKAFNLKRTAETDIKQAAFDFATHREAEQVKQFPWKMSRNGKLHAYNYDVTDAFVVACYTYNHCRARALCDCDTLRSEFADQFQYSGGKPTKTKSVDALFEEAVIQWCFLSVQ